MSGIGRSKAQALIDVGIKSKRDLRMMSQQEIASVEGIGNALAARIKADVGDL